MGQDLLEREATSDNNATICPVSVNPHALRRSYITEELNAGQPEEVSTERVDMSREMMDKLPRQGDEEQADGTV